MSDMTTTNLAHPLSRFFLREGRRGLVWEAWQYGWKLDDDEQPDRILGRFATKDLAMRAIEEQEAYEKERYGVWRFFVDD